MDYNETLAYLYDQLPAFQRIGKAAYKSDLNTSLELDKYFNHPHKTYKSIHVAGTNGKGSVSHILASILQEAGYKCGLYTSPHLKDFRERIKINGKPIPKDEVVKFVAGHSPIFEKLKSSFFEMTVALALYYFQKEGVDYAVIETGMGGRLDSTNIISPELSVITSIGYDHTEFLGDTIEKIAREKAGIIKPNTPVIIGDRNDELRNVFNAAAKNKNAPISFASDNVQLTPGKINSGTTQSFTTNINGLEIIQTDLLGNYQHKNIATALQTTIILEDKGIHLSKVFIQRGINNVVVNTGLWGRWQIIQKKPFTVCDIAHNEEGFKAIIDQIQSASFKQLHMVIGFVKDKDTEKLLTLLPKDAIYYYCEADIPRSLDIDTLYSQAENTGLKGTPFASVADAYMAAKLAANDEDMIFIGGSTFVVAEIL